MATVLTLHDGQGERSTGGRDGERVLKEAAALLSGFLVRALPDIDPHDPYRGEIEALATRYGDLAVRL